MLSSISPLGERARNRRWFSTTVAYVVGSLIGGMALGGLSSLVGSLVPEAVRGSRAALVVLAVAFLVGVLVDTRNPQKVPSWHRQVDEVWLTTYRGWVYGLGFGVQLGFGLVTIVTSTTTYATIALAALSGSVPAGVLVGAVFGLVRALPSVLMRRVDTRFALDAAFRVVERWAPRAHVIARATLVAGAVVLMTVALSSTYGGVS